MTFEIARGRRGGTGPAGSANFPASANGGGALNRRVGGDGSRGGTETDSSGASERVFRDGGGGGGPRLLVELEPVSWGLIEVTFGAGGAEGGGGGADSAAAACFWSIQALMNSEFSAIWSSVIPIPLSSSSSPFQEGSLVSNGKSGLAGGRLGDSIGGGGATCIEGAGAVGAGVLRAGLERCNKLPNKDRPTFPLVTGAGPWPRLDAKGVLVVSLLACFSRSCTFLIKVLASFSSTKDRPAGQASSSNV